MRRHDAPGPGDVASTGPDGHRIRASRTDSRLLLLMLLVGWMTLGCVRGASLQYAQVLDGPEHPRDVAARIRQPSEDCREQARHFVGGADLYPAPLPDELRSGYARVLRSLHPSAKQVLRRTGGVWFARSMSGASARFIPCKGEAGRQGLILVDVSSNPLGDELRDVDVPHRYWQLLGGSADFAQAPSAALASSRANHLAARYVLLHELGHALSLLTGEFELSPSRHFELRSWDGFSALSWRPRETNAVGSELNEHGGVVPTRLALVDWRRVRRALGSSSTWLAPGYQRESRLTSDLACAMVDRLPLAGFVTPTAATAPTEDYAETFAHALLADEGKVHPGDVLEVQLPGCETRTMEAPYFSSGMKEKRAYMERHLGLRPAVH